MAQLAARTPASIPLPLLGVCIAVSGNVLIALALNVQKLAHTRLQQPSPPTPPPIQQPAAPPGGNALTPPAPYGSFPPPGSAPPRTASPLPALAEAAAHPMPPAALAEHLPPPHPSSVSFLRSRLWWIGIGLMTLGEAGNFISYGFAPASLIAPLGSAALLANVFLAPVVVGERLDMADIAGAALCALGAVGVVWSVPSTRTDPVSHDALVRALQQRTFIVYCLVDVGVAVVLSLLSLTPIGDTVLLVDLGVCACLGSLTVLATKSLSGLLTGGAEEGGGFDGFVAALEHPLLLALLAVLASTAVGQVVFLNRALQRFDASRVIPTHFTLFTISAILGSAVLFRDFASCPPLRILCFLMACSTTFIGVYVLARDKKLSPLDVESASPTVPVCPHAATVASPRVPEPAPTDPSQPVLVPPLRLRPQLRTMATDTMLLPPRSAGSKDAPSISNRARRYLTGPALALSTGHYLLLPFNSSGATRGPEHPALTQPMYMTREAQSDSGHHHHPSRHWSHIVPQPSLAFPSLSRSFDQRPLWTEIFAPRPPHPLEGQQDDIESTPLMAGHNSGRDPNPSPAAGRDVP